MKRKKKNYRYFFYWMGIFFSVIVFVVMIAGIVIPDRGFSEKENRVLSSRPELSLAQAASGQFGKKYETYVNDQFPLRDFWVTLKARTDRLMGKVEENGVYLGKDGYLMEEFQAPSQDQLNTTVNAMVDFAQRHPELNQYVLIAPNAVNILEEKLPAFAPAQDQNPYLDAVKEAVESAGVTYIDVRETLSSHKDEGLYYHTDHHWTTQGAYYAFLQAADTMGINTGEVSYEKCPVTYSFQGTLSAKSGFRSGEKEELDVFLPKGDTPSSVVNYVQQQKKTASFYSTEKLDTRDKYALFFDGNHPQVKINTPVEENKTLLILKDSYANSFVPFLAPHYRTIIMIDPRYYYGDLEELIQVENVQDVLYLYNANTFFSDTSLELALSSHKEAVSSQNNAGQETSQTQTGMTEGNGDTAGSDSQNESNTDGSPDTDTGNTDESDSANGESWDESDSYDEESYDEESYDESYYDEEASYDNSEY